MERKIRVLIATHHPKCPTTLSVPLECLFNDVSNPNRRICTNTHTGLN